MLLNSYEKIILNDKSLEMTVGEEQEIKFSTEPEQTEAEDLEWISSDEDVAEVDDYGKITAISAGKTKITVQTEDGEVSANLNVVVKPETTEFNSVKTSKKKIILKWDRVNGVGGYQISYSTSKTFKGAKNIKEKAKSTTSTIKNLRSKKTYYIRIRTYQTISGKKYYSSWSSIGSIKVK